MRMEPSLPLKGHTGVRPWIKLCPELFLGKASSSPASTPVVQRRVRCLKKRVVFNVSEGVEGEAGMSLEEKSREIQDQLEPKVQVVNASHLLQVNKKVLATK